MTSAHDTGQIIAFYSYKGGTGRTMALANTAWILASNGLKVLAVDWDLESPGLHRFFHPFLDENTVSSTTGVVDIISDYMWATAKPHDDQDWHLQYARVLPHAVSLNWRFPGEGTLDFVSAGQQNRDYSAMPSIFDWDNFYERLGGGQFIAALRADMKANYDYILIDSRTGLSDIADICTIALPDILVDCFTMSDQSINGAAEVARHIDARYPDKRIRILPVLMRVDDGEKKKVDTGRLHARSMFEGFPKGLTAEETSAYWGSVEIPYKRFYAFEETLATFGDEPGSPGSMLAAFERLTAAITGGVVSAFPPLEDAVRTRWLDMFTRRQPARQPDVLISYAPEDRMWADWVAALLEQAGFRVTVHALHEPDIADDVEHARFTATIAILSAAYARAFHSWASVQEPAADGPSDMIVLRVTDVRLTPPFNLRPPADLVRLGQDDAIEVVLRAVSRLRSGHDLRVAADSLSVRYPGTAPTLWNVGTRNAAFTGRNATLETLRNELLGSNKAVVLPQALYGLGGVGKTQVALEYAHRFAADYDVVWWISAEQRDLISPQLAELARQMGLPVTDSVVETAEAARDALRRGEPWSRWLLIFDNAEDPEDIEPFLPGGGFGHVIVTSRNQLWSSVASPLEVDVFSLDESVEHLIRRVPRLSRAEAEQVAEALGNLPLAVEQAAAWLSETGLPASEYVWELQTQAPRSCR
ncbi:FxSxx-COOH system tetratricopeptide repeat protein [Thermocatellispora tengchongensis]|uniref:FxSxx-COOH system tetratricopeptide repeat protein n=1 Tax=Thermocatellispora tengchongensis TaxID=1073253 RepID=UPI003641AA55